MRTASFLLYLKSERPEEWRQITRIGALRDYLVYRLAGVWVTDPTSGPGEGEWPPEIIAMTEMARECFPPTLPPQQVVGGLLPDAAELLKLPAGTPIVVGLHDGAASSIGARSIHVGDACLTLGTNFVLRAITGERLTARSFSYLVLPERWAWVNNVHKASAQLDIVAELLHEVAHQEVRESHASLGRFADEVAPGCNGLVIERMLAGQEREFRLRIDEARLAGHSQGHIYRALMESLASGVLDLLQRARRDGATPSRFVATGGGVHNRHFLRLLAAMLDAPIEVAQAEAGLIGAGIVAAVGGGWYATVTEAVDAMTAPGEILYPDPITAKHYRIQREHDGVNL
jgi:sugar (pentulose or hexulose) kinase